MDEDFNNECIKAHNELRSLHRSPNIHMSRKLTKDSQEWANFIAGKLELKHSNTNGQYGENISFSSVKESGEEVTIRWYKEVFDYKFGQERQEIAKVGHFTQVIWNESIEAGFARAMSKDGHWYTVGRYIKAGNVIGHFVPNVNHFIPGWHNLPLIKKMREESNPQLKLGNSSRSDKSVTNDKNEKMKNKHDHMNQSYGHNDYIGSLILENVLPKKSEDPVTQISVKANNAIPSPKQETGEMESDYDSEDLITFQKELLQQHNNLRQLHGVHPLSLNETLSKMAQDSAHVLKETRQLRYFNQKYMGGELGENIAIIIDCDLLVGGRRLIDRWYKEHEHFKYGQEPKNVDGIGHFSQIVWASSQQLGIGVSKTLTNKSFVVCLYFPAGNVEGKFSDNVHPTLDVVIK